MRSDILDILQNDVKIVDASTRTLDNRGVTVLRLSGEYFPDGRPLEAEVPEKMEPAVLRDWCNTVRIEFNARQNRKEAAEARERDSDGVVDRGPSAPAKGPGRGVGPDQASRETVEADLEALLQSKVDQASELVRLSGQVRDQAAEELGRATEQHESAIRELARTQACLDFLRSQTNESN
jgi:hypothetical protein